MEHQPPRPGGRVTLEVVDGIAEIVLDRPSAHNALTVTMIGELAAAVDAVRRDDDVRAVVLRGAGGRAFSAGGDLGELIPRLTAGELEVLIPDPTRRFFSDLYVPVIAAVEGICVAGGLEILLGTDIRIASTTATFGLPEVRWGLVPGGGSHVRLFQQVGWAPAMQMLLTGESIDASHAHRIGLVGELVEPEKVVERAWEVARQVARNAPVAVRTAKEIAVRAWSNEARFALETDLNRRVLATDDAREGPAAFTERRAPHYRNR
ncbi:enoyl-CoA hydratase/isomerase family protein [Nocardioides zeae]|uniref:Enoyl-CoA hydratase/isomerase family protein n=1 Tax=Nocardioides imazamoxiresistens TaxID=3231893 RepID=A0ABU3PSQ0_9ACTN|nr:enoyl-CoA hydratase/isomerase family protein [Nocardioides zeae]MDT9592213.1 enoyl-CoA hydratase/isomerase family protein [Nocardioides zeae]